jgi:uncharacterized protein YndB with AHSA1/START domain
MSAQPKLVVSLPSDLEITLTRTFDAPRDLVFEAFSKPEHVTRWWGQRDSRTSVEAMDFRPGGAWRFVEHAADGNEYVFCGEYRAIERPELIEWTFEFAGMPGHVSVERMHFEQHDGQTTIVATSHFDSVEDRDGMLQSGMEQGAGESYARLEEYLVALAGTLS